MQAHTFSEIEAHTVDQADEELVLLWDFREPDDEFGEPESGVYGWAD